MGSVISVSPFQCRMWFLHSRIEDYITEENCRLEIESLEEHGQLLPVLGRCLPRGSEYRYELIYGARRLFAARYLNKPLMVEVSKLSDRSAIVAMDIENRHRKELSALERGLNYRRWLESGHFESQDDLARSLKVSGSQVSRLLQLAELPTIVVGAFPEPAEIRETWGVQLAEAIRDPVGRSAVLRAASALAGVSPRPRPREIYDELLAASRRCKQKESLEQVIKDDDGATLFRVKHHLNSVCLIVPVERISAACLYNIERVIARILENNGARDESPAASEVVLD